MTSRTTASHLPSVPRFRCRATHTTDCPVTIAPRRAWISATAILKTEFGKDLWLTDNFRVGNYFFDSRETAAHEGTAPPAPGTPLDTVLTSATGPACRARCTR